MAVANLTGALIEVGRQLAADVAAFLSECEHILRISPSEGVAGSGRLIDPASDHEEMLIQHDRIQRWRTPRRFKSLDLGFLEKSGGSHRRSEQHPSDHWGLQPLERRLAGLVFHYWPRLANEEGRRLDVLHITASLLANPARPFTYQLARFGLISGLRAQYGIRGDHEGLQRIQEAYEALKTRLSQPGPSSIPEQHESFLIDVCCLCQFLSRVMIPGGADNLSAYYSAFGQHPFGVATNRDRGTVARRSFPVPSKIHLEGELPALPVLLNIIFNQPLGIPGLDEVLGGLRAPFRGPVPGHKLDRDGAVRGGGVVTLIAGPAGVGKTTVSVAIASRMAEFGADVRYVATEEEVLDLLSKRTTVVGDNFLFGSMWPGVAQPFAENLEIHSGQGLETLAQAIDDLIGPLERAQSTESTQSRGEVYLDFPYVVVIDSVATLLGDQDDLSGSPIRVPEGRERRTLASQLRRLREARVCVFLVGERQHMNDARLAYLVDNVLTLDFEDNARVSRPLRVLSIEKTRYQICHRGRHVFHISRFNGPVVNPALTAILAETEEHPERDRGSRNDTVSVLCVARNGGTAHEDREGDPDAGQRAVVMPTRTHSLLYGWGSSGKAQIALAMALHPAVPASLRPAAEEARWSGGYTPEETARAKRSRVLVISFLFEPAYYHGIAEPLLRGFGVGLPDRDKGTKAVEKEIEKDIGGRVSVLHFYPGSIDPETFLGRVRELLLGARLEGRAFSGVVIDGIQNMLLQFPRLSKEELLWPTLFRILRSAGVNSVSTFTFFSIFGSDFPQISADAPQRASMLPDEAQRMLHLLVIGSSDYSIRLERQRDRHRVRLICTNTATSVGRGVSDFLWDSRSLKFAMFEAGGDRGG
jgi:hypothetical protein